MGIEWLEKREITHVVLVILAKDDGRTLERWTFDVQQRTPSLLPPSFSTLKPIYSQKPPSDTSEIAVLNVLKQIVAATTSLPDLPSPAVFTLQTYVQEEAARRVTNAGILASEPELMMDDWRDVTEDGPLPFGEGVETQQTFLRGVTTNESDVNLLLTALDD